MGDLEGSGSSEARFVSLGQVFLVRFAAQVTSGQTGTQPDVTGNLMKFGSVNTAGAATTLRDRVDLTVAANQVAINKSIYQVNGAPVPGNARGAVDDFLVKAGDRVTWRVDVRNSAPAGAPPIRNVVVFDTLPAGIACSDVSVTAVDPDPSPPAWTCTAGVITWGPILGPITANSWATYPLLFDMTMPTSTTVSTTYTNRAQVTSYEVQANTGDWLQVLPVNVRDTSRVHTPGVSVTKAAETGFVGTNNDLLTQFTIGETITYTVDGVDPGQDGRHERDPERHAAGRARLRLELGGLLAHGADRSRGLRGTACRRRALRRRHRHLLRDELHEFADD